MCPKSYELHYIERIRPNGITSPLVFGAALDAALNLILSGKPEEAESEFTNKFTTQEINGVSTYLPTYKDIAYSSGDFDADILTESDASAIKEVADKNGVPSGSILQDIKNLRTKTKSESQLIVYNYACWVCLHRKGILMLKAYKEKIMPKIKNVIAIQKEISLDNGNGDAITGFIDAIVELKRYGKVIMDNKTSSRPYEKDSVITSEQLSLYKHSVGDEYGITKGAYAVLLKRVNKNRIKICVKCGHDKAIHSHTTCPNMIDEVRCRGELTETLNPEIEVQLIVDDISPITEEQVISDADTVNEMISKKMFDKNLKQCDNWYGSKCPYYNYCRTGDMTGLSKMEKRNGEK